MDEVLAFQTDGLMVAAKLNNGMVNMVTQGLSH